LPIHLPKYQSHSSIESFLQAFRRFASRRRGLPALLLTDDAKTFKSASKKVHRILRSAEVQRALANKLRCSVGVYYRKAPWHGGFWEGMVKSVKRCLKKILGKTALNFEALITIPVEVETTINNRLYNLRLWRWWRCLLSLDTFRLYLRTKDFSTAKRATFWHDKHLPVINEESITRNVGHFASAIVTSGFTHKWWFIKKYEQNGGSFFKDNSFC
jgi:hypothetical protein